MILRSFISEMDYTSPNTGSGLILNIVKEFQDDISIVELFITKSQNEGFFLEISNFIGKELSNSNIKLVTCPLAFESIPKTPDSNLVKKIVTVIRKMPDEDQKIYINCAEKIGKNYWPLIHKELKADYYEIRKSGDSFKIIGGDKWGNYIGNSDKIIEMKKDIENLAKHNIKSPILLIGETGVGKSYLSKIIKNVFGLSEYKQVNCGSFRTDNQGFNINLFGGNYNSKIYPSAIEDAGDGVLELSEIGNLERDVQQSLNALFDDMTYTKMPGGQTKKAKCLFVGTTNVHINQIKEDLAARVRVINIPSLCERPDDIEPLIEWFIKKKSIKLRLTQINFHSSCISHLRSLQWSNNIRQLEYFIQDCYINSDISDRENILWDDVRKNYNEYGKSDNSLSEIVIQYPLNDKNLNDHTHDIAMEYTKDAVSHARKNRDGEPRPRDIAKKLNFINPDGTIRDDLAQTKLDQLNKFNSSS